MASTTPYTPWTPITQFNSSPETPQVTTPETSGELNGWSDKYRSWSTGNMGALVNCPPLTTLEERRPDYERRPVKQPFWSFLNYSSCSDIAA